MKVLGSALALLMPLVLGACNSHEGPPELTSRFQAMLAPELAGGQVALQPLPDGARVVINQAALFRYGSANLDDRGRALLTSAVEALLDPRLLRIDIAGPAPEALQQARANTVVQFIRSIQVAPELRLAGLQQSVTSGITPEEVAITVTFVAQPG